MIASPVSSIRFWKFEEFRLFIPDGFIYLCKFVLNAAIQNGADVFLQEREDAVRF